MTNARPMLPIGQLLGEALRAFRRELYRRAREAGHRDIREAHLQVFGVIDWSGTRLTELASRANMAPPSMSELVDDLTKLGYVVRVPDLTDRRAKLIVLTRAGRRLVVQARRATAEIERSYAAAVGEERFHSLATTLADLVEAQRDAGRQGRAAAAPPSSPRSKAGARRAR